MCCTKKPHKNKKSYKMGRGWGNTTKLKVLILSLRQKAWYSLNLSLKCILNCQIASRLLYSLSNYFRFHLKCQYEQFHSLYHPCKIGRQNLYIIRFSVVHLEWCLNSIFSVTNYRLGSHHFSIISFSIHVSLNVLIVALLSMSLFLNTECSLTLMLAFWREFFICQDFIISMSEIFYFLLPLLLSSYFE